jgi:uncharacterized protein YjbI with pentapeptide repeats
LAATKLLGLACVDVASLNTGDFFMNTRSKSSQLNILLLSSLLLTSVGFAQPSLAANPAHVRQLLQTGECEGCDLTRANLRNANLRSAKLNGANLTGANLSGANLSKADLDDAILRGANLAGANLDDADFTEANLQGANLTGTLNLREARFCNAIMPDGRRREMGMSGFFRGKCR